MSDQAISPASIPSDTHSERRQVDDDLCDVCQGMRIDSLIDWIKSEWEARDLPTILPTPLPTHLEHGRRMKYGTPSQIACRLNCSFCRLVLRLLNRESCSSIVREEGPGPSRSMAVVINCVSPWRHKGFSVSNDGETKGRIMTGLLDEYVGYAEDECPQGALQSTYPLRPFQLNPNQIRLWLDECITSHVQDANQHISPRHQAPIDLIFVDVSRGCLVKKSSSSRFIALSYVWGQVMMLQTTTKNRLELEQDGALFSKYPEMPAVIQDAILLVRMLDEQFLWVDALCIEQDNIAQKHNQIAQMDVVYSHAFLTMVALSGDNAAACLPGVRPGTRVDAFAKGVVKGLELYAYPYIDIRNNVYETRAWTFQERLLSRRCLYFTPHMVLYTCHAHLQSEKGIDQYLSTNFSNSYRDLNQHIQQFELRIQKYQLWISRFEVYASLVHDYSKRELTYPKDVLFAFSGILSVLQRYTGSRSLSGLLESFLDQCLLWVPYISKDARRNYHFPSWSWAGWTGQCGYLLNPLYKYPAQQLVYNSLKSEIDNFQSRYETPYRTVQRAGRTAERTDDDADGTGSGQDVLLFDAWSASIHMFETRTARQVLDGLEKSNGRWTRSHVVYITTVTFLTAIEDWVMLYDLKGRHCGILYGLEAQENHQNRNRELVLLSKGQVAVRDLVATNKKPTAGPFDRLFDNNTSEPTEWCLLNVMLIEWADGRAERLTIGHIHEKAWLDANPERKRIKLY